jgi:methyltransferase (TIGR00027 family)
MIKDQPSRTAHRVALRRAAHQLWDNPRVFDDPVALKIIGPDHASKLRQSVLDDGAMERSLRAFIVARSRYAEDQLADACSRGVKQYVVLGAGLDTFAYRNPFRDLRVFEVDHPATQEWKRQILASTGISIPVLLTYVPVDFEKEPLAQGLESAGFNAQEPAFFSWLGVTPYLSRETVLGTLQWLISICPRNAVVFDYAVLRSSLSPIHRLGFDVLANRVAAAGEPFVGFFEPQEFGRELRQMGFAHIEDFGSAEINLRYFNQRRDGLGVTGGGRLMAARGF